MEEHWSVKLLQFSISHATRMKVNRAANERERMERPEAILLKVGKVAAKDNNPQSMWIWPGKELIGAGGRAKKGLFYRVVACTDERVVLQGDGETLGLSAENAVKHLRLTALHKDFLHDVVVDIFGV